LESTRQAVPSGVDTLPEVRPGNRKEIVPGVIALIIVLIVLTAPLYLQKTVSDEDRLHAQIRPAVEKIAAQLSEVSGHLAVLEALRGALATEGVVLSADTAAGAVETEPNMLDEVDQQLAETARLLEALHRNYPRMAGGQPASVSLGGPAQYGQLARSTFAQFEKVLKENESLLNQTAKEIQELTRLSIGEASARSNVAVNQLAALVSYQQGLVSSNRADLHRRMVARDRELAATLLAIITEIRQESVTLAAVSSDVQLQSIRARIDGLESAHQQQQAGAEQIEALITHKEQEASNLRTEALEARRELDRLEWKAITPEDPLSIAKAFEAFQDKYLRLAARARRAEAEADAIEYGTLEGAVLREDPRTDLLHAPYEGGDFAPGLVVLRAAAEALREQMSSVSDQIESARKQEEILEAAIRERESQREAATQLLKQSVETVDRLLARADERMILARGDEEAALKALDAAFRHTSTAATAAQQRVSSARQLATAAAERPNERLASIVNDKDTEAGVRFLAAEIAYEQGGIYFNRLLDLQAADSAAAKRALLLGEPEPSATHSAALAEARAQAREVLERAVSELSKAESMIKTAQYTIGGVQIQGSHYRWQFLSAQAAAHLLLAQISESDEEYFEQRDLAYSLLTEAAKGREGSPLLAAIVDMIRYLQESAQ
jgi:hypothetical protein